jgi:hypothetical protein
MVGTRLPLPVGGVRQIGPFVRAPGETFDVIGLLQPRAGAEVAGAGPVEAVLAQEALQRPLAGADGADVPGESHLRELAVPRQHPGREIGPTGLLRDVVHDLLGHGEEPPQDRVAGERGRVAQTATLDSIDR